MITATTTIQNDPNQRKDSFKDLYNNAFGRDVALLGAKNDWSFETITSVIAQGVRDGVAIVDHLDPNDARIPPIWGNFPPWTICWASRTRLR
jgi:hypothetical protein